MDFSNYEAYIRELVEKITEEQFDNEQSYLEACHEIVKAGTRAKDAHLLGLGYYYLAEGYFQLNDYSHFTEYLVRGISYQREAGQGMLLTRSYNMMGINAVSQGNITVALDHYLQGLKYGTNHRCQYESALIYINLGQLYMKLKQHPKAADYFQRARELLEAFGVKPSAKRNLLLAYTLLGRCYLEQGKLQDAKAMEVFINVLEQEQSKKDSGEILREIFRVQLRHLEGQTEERNQGIARILQSLNSQEIMMKIWEDVLTFGEFLLNFKKYTELNQLCGLFEELGQKLEIVNLKAECLGLKIRYYREIGDWESYQKSCVTFYEYQEIQERENIEIISRSVELRFSLEEAQGKAQQLLKETTILKEKSETDALTGLPNRYKLNEYAEEVFERAYQNRENLGVEILDVDCFKTYNDRYGHPAGDEYLKMVANLLQKRMEADPEVFCARYGGDEFVVIFYGKTDEEILTWAKKLKKEIIENDDRSRIPMTISQGIRNLRPKEKNRVWDYLYSADGALYEVKQKQKNGICLVHEVSSESLDTIMITRED